MTSGNRGREGRGAISSKAQAGSHPGRSEMVIKGSMGTLSLVALSVALGATTSRLPFIQDDYPRALAEATQRKVPLFVECWAPW
jgi:hypothetical protein